MSLLANKDVEIKDFAIRVFESWADPESLKILDNTVVTPEWLESYRKLVVKDLKTSFHKLIMSFLIRKITKSKWKTQMIHKVRKN